MSKIIGLPATITKSEVSEIIIDLSKLEFPCDKDKQVNAALLFMRNIGLPLKTTLDNCSYEQKSEFLFLYMTKNNLEVDIKDLESTWINVLARKAGIETSVKSILTNDEIDRFLDDHKDFINELFKLVISIPLVSINFFGESLATNPDNNVDLSEFDINQYKRNECKMINICSLVKLFEYDEFLVIQQSSEDIEPEWYVNYFSKRENRFYGLFMSKFPYLSMLNMFTSDNKLVRDRFIELYDETLKIDSSQQG